jgi:CPA1 family monovalent cation:H+ antiporter
MELFRIFIILIVLAAFFSYINARYLHIPSTIGMIIFGLGFSISLIILEQLGLPLKIYARNLLAYINFRELLLSFLLSFLLFAGALDIDLNDLLPQRGAVLSLASAGVLISTLLVGGFTLLILRFFHTDVPLLDCLLFGALISPTDPVAVLSLMKVTGASKQLKTLVAGESLFNDGFGLIVFITIESLIWGSGRDLFADISLLFAQQIMGGILLGLATGCIAYQMLKRLDEYKSEILITLALVMGRLCTGRSAWGFRSFGRGRFGPFDRKSEKGIRHVSEDARIGRSILGTGG